MTSGDDDGTSSQRVDERDTMFARAARRPGTDQYEDYYRRRPELREVDDRLRRLPPLLSPEGRYYAPEIAAETARTFAAIETIQPADEDVGPWVERIASTGEPTRVLVEMAVALGAGAAGAAAVDEAWLYSHKGRLDHDYGRPVAADLPWALVFLVEMDHRQMARAPRAPTVLESARQYHRAARISHTIAAALRAAGAAARSHYDAHYEVLLPPLAVAAGLGELGRNNILVADRFGARVRLGAVTTDLPLSPAVPVDLGVHAFCQRCKKCSDNCPTGSLSAGEPELIRGVTKWPTRVERCYAYWRRIGTDCGVCMAVCPFSHRDDWFHALVRRLVRLHPLAARLALVGDDLVYGRRWRPR